MSIRIESVGAIRYYTAKRELQLEVQHKVTLGDVLAEIGARWADSFPMDIWDAKRGLFTDRVLILRGDGRRLESPDLVLEDDESLRVVLPVGGG